MPKHIPSRDQLIEDLAQAWKEAGRRHVVVFDTFVEETRAAGEWLPDDVGAIRARLVIGDIGLYRAIWLLEEPRTRGDFEAFQEKICAARISDTQSRAEPPRRTV